MSEQPPNAPGSPAGPDHGAGSEEHLDWLGELKSDADDPELQPVDPSVTQAFEAIVDEEDHPSGQGLMFGPEGDPAGDPAAPGGVPGGSSSGEQGLPAAGQSPAASGWPAFDEDAGPGTGPIPPLNEVQASDSAETPSRLSGDSTRDFVKALAAEGPQEAVPAAQAPVIGGPEGTPSDSGPSPLFTNPDIGGAPGLRKPAATGSGPFSLPEQPGDDPGQGGEDGRGPSGPPESGEHAAPGASPGTSAEPTAGLAALAAASTAPGVPAVPVRPARSRSSP